MNKKGSFWDLPILIVAIFAISIMFALTIWGLHLSYTKILQSAGNLTAVGYPGGGTQLVKDTIGKADMSFQSFRWITGMLIVGFILNILVSSFLIRINPIFFVLYIVIWIISIIFSVPISNAYEIIYQTPAITQAFSGYYAQTYIMLHLPMWIAIVGFISAILMFTNMRRLSEEGYYDQGGYV